MLEPEQGGEGRKGCKDMIQRSLNEGGRGTRASIHIQFSLNLPTSVCGHYHPQARDLASASLPSASLASFNYCLSRPAQSPSWLSDLSSAPHSHHPTTGPLLAHCTVSCLAFGFRPPVCPPTHPPLPNFSSEKQIWSCVSLAQNLRHLLLQTRSCLGWPQDLRDLPTVSTARRIPGTSLPMSSPAHLNPAPLL